MTEQDTQTTLTGAESGLSATETPSVVEDTGEAPEGPENGTERPMPREQRYRLQLREAEAQRDALAQRIEAMQRMDIERVAAELLAQGSDIFMAGADVSEFLNDEGGIDYDRVRASSRELAKDRPGLSKNAPAFDPTQGIGGHTPKPKLGWDVLLHG